MTDGKNNINISITSGTIWKFFFIAILLALAYFLFDLILILLTSVVIASAVEPATKWLMKYKIPRVLSVLAVYVVSFFVVLGFLYMFLPPLITEVSQLARNLPTEVEPGGVSNPFFEPFLSIAGIGHDLVIKDVIKEAETYLREYGGGILSTASTAFGGAFSFILILVISFYLAVQERGIENFLRIVLPTEYEAYSIGLWKRSQIKIGQWMKGQLVLALIIGVLVFLGLTIFGVRFAFILAVIAALFELIPVFGPILAAVPAVILAFTDGVTAGIMVIAFYVVIQQFENHLIYPLVVKKIVGVSPIIVIIALIIGAKVAGFLGIILAVPIATVLMEVASDIGRQKKIKI